MRATRTLLSTVIAFVFTFLMNTGLEYVTQTKGSIIIGPPLNTRGGQVLPIDIDNYRNKAIDGVKIIVPKNFKLANIGSSFPIQILVEPDHTVTTPTKVLVLSGFAGNIKTKMLFPLETTDQAAVFKILNAKDKNLIMLPVEGISDPLRRALNDAALSSLIYAFLVGLFYFYYYGESDKLRKEISQLKESSNVSELKIVETEATCKREHAEDRKRHLRLKLYLLARINDYSKELSFWRNTMRNVLIKSGKDEASVNTLLKEISTSLQTQSTHSEIASDFKTIEVMASLMASADRGGRKSES